MIRLQSAIWFSSCLSLGAIVFAAYGPGYDQSYLDFKADEIERRGFLSWASTLDRASLERLEKAIGERYP